MLKIRRPLGRLIFNMGIAIPGKTVFLIETAPRPSRCWVDTDSVSLALNLFLRLQSTMLSRLAWRFQKFYINQFMFTYGNIRPDYVNLYQDHQKCAVMILCSIDMHSLCKYGRKNGYLPACIIMFIHLIVTLSVLNDIVIMPDEFINKKMWNRYDAGSAPIVLAQHRTVRHAYLLQCYRESHDFFHVVHKPMCVYKLLSQATDQIMVTHINAIKSGLSRCPN